MDGDANDSCEPCDDTLLLVPRCGVGRHERRLADDVRDGVANDALLLLLSRGNAKHQTHDTVNINADTLE